MKKNVHLSLVFAFGLLFSFHSTAQSLRYGLRAGAGFAKFNYEPTVDSSDTEYYAGMWYEKKGSFRPSFMAAGVLEYDLSKDFFLSSGLQVSAKFSKVMAEERYFSEYSVNDFRLRTLYLQIPVSAHYRAGKFFLGAGGYLGLGLSGNWKNTNTLYVSDGVTLKIPVVVESAEPVKFGTDLKNTNLKRVDAGLRAELGLGLKTIRLSLAYEYGLINNLASGANPNGPNFDSKLHHQAIYATATYYWLAK